MASAMEVPALNDITIVTGGADGVDREANDKPFILERH